IQPLSGALKENSTRSTAVALMSVLAFPVLTRSTISFSSPGGLIVTVLIFIGATVYLGEIAN
ncbi:hypothetical protein, partial [Devosia sp.]|uniref:hypothetical protein n=1 Tax=Devosia sp. TaxID=1871048 RepID=UPI001AC0165B